jgi:hypothetical protein
MRMPPPTTVFDGLHVTLTENQRKVDLQTPPQDDTNPKYLEEWLEL